MLCSTCLLIPFRNIASAVRLGVGSVLSGSSEDPTATNLPGAEVVMRWPEEGQYLKLCYPWVRHNTTSEVKRNAATYPLCYVIHSSLTSARHLKDSFFSLTSEKKPTAYMAEATTFRDHERKLHRCLLWKQPATACIHRAWGNPHPD